MFEKVIYIIGAPRSGTTMLFRTLALHKDIWHLRAESHSILEGPYHPKKFDYVSNVVDIKDVYEKELRSIRELFYYKSINLNKVFGDNFSYKLLTKDTLTYKATYYLTSKVLEQIQRKSIKKIFVEKTPKNSLRLELLDKLFSNACYVWIIRNPYDNIKSIVNGWYYKSIFNKRFAKSGYKILNKNFFTDYEGNLWKFLLPPGWEKLKNKNIPYVASYQYYISNKYTFDFFKKRENINVIIINYEDYIKNPNKYLSKILSCANLNLTSTLKRMISEKPVVNKTGKSQRKDFIIPSKIDIKIQNLLKEINEYK